MSNLVRKIFYGDDTWVAPAGVTSVTAVSMPINYVVSSANSGSTNASSINIDINNDAYAWGSNVCGALGNGSITVACLPTLVCCGLKWRSISTGGVNKSSAGISTNGDAYAWGSNECGKLGIGSITVQCLPTLVCCGLKWKNITVVAGAGQSTAGITTSGDAYAWGSNECGVLGNGSITAVCLPTLVCCGLKWRQLSGSHGGAGSYMVGLTTTRDAYAWGSNDCGALGIGSISVKCLPTLVCCGLKWRQVSAGAASVIGITTTCDAYAWGQNRCGILGNGSINVACLPTLVCCGLKWRQVSIGDCHAVGITYDGDMYAWGSNACGALGNGSITVACLPTLVCCGLKWRYGLARTQYSLGVTVDGDMFAWGTNVCGVQGNGSITATCLPTLVCCAKTWLP